MPLITRIAGVRVELRREAHWFDDITHPYVTWYDDANSELYGLGILDQTTLDDDVTAISSLMQWAMEEKYPMMPLHGPRWVKLASIEADLLTFYGKDWRENGRDLPYVD